MTYTTKQFTEELMQVKEVLEEYRNTSNLTRAQQRDVFLVLQAVGKQAIVLRQLSADNVPSELEVLVQALKFARKQLSVGHTSGFGAIVDLSAKIEPIIAQLIKDGSLEAVSGSVKVNKMMQVRKPRVEVEYDNDQDSSDDVMIGGSEDQSSQVNVGSTPDAPEEATSNDATEDESAAGELTETFREKIERHRGASGDTTALGDQRTPIPANPTVDKGDAYDTVQVYYTTDRKRVKKRTKIFGGLRNKDQDPFSYGVCAVSMPHSDKRKIGELNAPNWKRFEFRFRPAEHIGILAEQPFEQDNFFAALRDLTDTQGTLLFVHGFNVSFVDAVRTTAQLKHDLDFSGVAHCFSWPSRGKLSVRAYGADAATVTWSTHNLRAHVEQLIERCQNGPIYIIAHSMGNRALLDMLAQLSEEHAKRIAEVVMAAPDVDGGAFPKLIADFNKTRAKHTRMTLYGSSEDIALKFSKGIHGGQQRAGETNPYPTVIEEVETIDASAVEAESLIGHSYYQQSRPIITDLFSLIRGSDISKRYALDEEQLNGLPYWVMRP